MASMSSAELNTMIDALMTKQADAATQAAIIAQDRQAQINKNMMETMMNTIREATAREAAATVEATAAAAAAVAANKAATEATAKQNATANETETTKLPEDQRVHRRGVELQGLGT